MLTRSVLVAGALALLLLASCESESPGITSSNLEGMWDLVSYVDHGVTGVTTGTMTFNGDGTFTSLGTVTYPWQPADIINMSGTYDVVGSTLQLTTTDGTSPWLVYFLRGRCYLSLVGSNPPTRIILKRRAPGLPASW